MASKYTPGWIVYGYVPSIGTRDNGAAWLCLGEYQTPGEATYQRYRYTTPDAYESPLNGGRFPEVKIVRGFVYL